MAKRILIAEDCLAHANVMRSGLKAAGYDVTVMTDGQEAWVATQRKRFDIVITDYQMRHLTGIKLCKLLRQDRRYFTTPVILVSASGRELDPLSGVHFSAFLKKPFLAADLLTTVDACLFGAVAI